MASALAPASNKIVSHKAQSIVYIRSIEVKFEDERNRHPVSIKATLGEDDTDKSEQYDKDDYVHWDWERRLPSDSKLTLTIREHHKFNRTRDVAYVAISLSDLAMKPFFETVVGERSTSVIVHCGEVGPFIDVIRSLVEQSQKQLEEMKVFLDKFGRACEILGYVVMVIDAVSSVHPAAEAAANAATALLEACGKMTEFHASASELMEDVATFLPFTDIPESGLKSEATAQTTEDILVLFERICKTITKYSSGSVLGALLDDRIDEIHTFKEKFKRLKETFGWCALTEIWKTTLKIEATTDSLLSEKLRPVRHASYRKDKLCFAGSRRDTLRAIEAWSESESSPPIFWLSGSSGLGKTRVAHTVAKCFRDQNRLAGYFLPSEGEISSEEVIPTIAYQMMKWHAEYHANIVSILLGPEELDLHAGLDEQFKLLMKKPILAGNVHTPPNHKPLIIVLDAVEKYRDPPSCRRSFVDFIMDIATLVPWLKVFVSSCPLAYIKESFDQHEIQHFPIDDPMLDLRHDIDAIARLRTATPKWTSGMEVDVRHLFDRIASSLHTLNAIEDVQAFDAAVCSSNIGEFFHVLIQRMMEKNELHDDDIPAVRDILAVMSCISSISPPSMVILSHFLRALLPGITQEYLHNVIATLFPIIHSGDEETLQFLFPPDIFSKFLSDQQQSGHLCTNLESLRSKLAQCSLDFMLTELKFNICGLGDRQLSNEDVLDMKERIDANISEMLRYCTLYWIHLVAQSGNILIYHDTVTDFLCTRKVLFWLEVLGLLGELDAGKEALLKYADQFKEDGKIFLAVRELQTYISQFEPVIKHSIPHLYIYAITWTTPDPLVMSGVTRGSLSGRTITFEGIAKQTENGVYIDSMYDVHCVTRSPDGSKIVSGSIYGTLNIRDGWTGERISEPIKGHAGSVHDVEYSPDGTKFVSGSSDKTMKIWNAWTGKLVQVLKSDSPVVAVAYSPNGGRVASGHDDGRVRIWDAQNGTLVTKLQDRHQFAVYSVSYSPDGTRIVSGSWDIRIWDAESGAAVSRLLEGHVLPVMSVVYSPDGSRIVSGSWDETVRIWDAHSGTPIGEPLEGHKDWVTDVGFSQDGNTIISAFKDWTIRFWNASDSASVGVLRRGESRWDTERQHFVSIPHWWPKRSFTTQALVYSANPIYILDDGWIRTLDGDLFLWVPRERRACSYHAAWESTMTTNPLDERLKNSAWKHIPQWSDIERMMTEEEPKQD